VTTARLGPVILGQMGSEGLWMLVEQRRQVDERMKQQVGVNVPLQHLASGQARSE
jgi:hypothetical protein